MAIVDSRDAADRATTVIEHQVSGGVVARAVTK